MASSRKRKRIPNANPSTTVSRKRKHVSVTDPPTHQAKTPPLLSLPAELLLNIVELLPSSMAARLRLSCKALADLAATRALRTVSLGYSDQCFCHPTSFNAMPFAELIDGPYGDSIQCFKVDVPWLHRNPTHAWAKPGRDFSKIKELRISQSTAIMRQTRQWTEVVNFQRSVPLMNNLERLYLSFCHIETIFGPCPAAQFPNLWILCLSFLDDDYGHNSLGQVVALLTAVSTSLRGLTINNVPSFEDLEPSEACKALQTLKELICLRLITFRSDLDGQLKRTMSSWCSLKWGWVEKSGELDYTWVN